MSRVLTWSKFFYFIPHLEIGEFYLKWSASHIYNAHVGRENVVENKTDVVSVFMEWEDKTQIYLFYNTTHLAFDIRYLAWLVIYLHVCLVPYQDGKFIEGGGPGSNSAASLACTECHVHGRHSIIFIANYLKDRSFSRNKNFIMKILFINEDLWGSSQCVQNNVWKINTQPLSCGHQYLPGLLPVIHCHLLEKHGAQTPSIYSQSWPLVLLLNCPFQWSNNNNTLSHWTLK